ncbi:hypothetical protein [Prosthecobacter sp.]|uniref:hypothetical protein n=1 Tax=Prosthecobacter sp. TaxID=1965333 RepID=UPI0037835096
MKFPLRLHDIDQAEEALRQATPHSATHTRRSMPTRQTCLTQKCVPLKPPRIVVTGLVHTIP